MFTCQLCKTRFRQEYDLDIHYLSDKHAIKVLEAENAELREALAWAWDNLGKSKPYPDEDSEYDSCVVCGAPEWDHRTACDLEEREAKARALLKGGNNG